jgi:hypothetical protein
MITINIGKLPNGFWQCIINIEGNEEKADLFHNPSEAMEWARNKVVWKYYDITKR